MTDAQFHSSPWGTFTRPSGSTTMKPGSSASTAQSPRPPITPSGTNYRPPTCITRPTRSAAGMLRSITYIWKKIAMDISDAKAILIVGPSSAKHEFYKHLEQHHRAMLSRVVGVETLDHPGDGPLLAHAAQAFREAARMGRPYTPNQK